MSSFILIYTLSLLSVCAQYALSADLYNNNGTRRYVHTQIVMEDLLHQKWMNDEVPCLELLVRIIKNVQNSTVWATWIWDSMQNPVGHLYGSINNYGNYDECVEFPWEKVDRQMRTQYCLTHIHLSEVDLEYDQVDLYGNVKNYLRAKTKHHLKFNTFKWGVCTPAACKPNAVIKFVSVLFGQTHLGLVVDKPNITVEYCDVAGDDKYEFDFGFYLTSSILALAIVGVLLATWMVSYKGPAKSNEFLMALHIPTNVQSLLEVADNEVKSLFGIRVISCIIMVSLHVWILMRSRGVINALRLNKNFDILSLAFPVEMTVDTFLLISGLLLVKNLPRNGSYIFKPFKMILKRYIRMIWLFGISLMIIINLPKNILHGPAKVVEFDPEIVACKKYWWANLLMIQNYVDPANMCYPVGWTVAVDFHLSIIGTMICWVFLRNKRAGLWVFMIGFITSILAPAIFVYHRGEMLLNMDFRISNDYRRYTIANPLHTSTHLRAGGYFVGMALGYIMYKYDPVAHRNVISKKHSVLGFCLFLTLFLGIFVACGLMLTYGYTVIQATMYASMKRVVWGVSIGMLIIICEYGKLPFISSFLSSSAWVLITKLSYGIYIVHAVFIIFSASIFQSPPTYHFFGLMLDTLGITALSIIISLFLWIFVEAPMYNIISLVFRTRNKVSREVMNATVKKQHKEGSKNMDKKSQ